jgi:hypothetical protein
LHPLEVGLHALRSGLEPKAYSEAVGKPRTSIQTKVSAARVASETHVSLTDDVMDRWRHLAEIHAAPPWIWHALVDAMLSTKKKPGGKSCQPGAQLLVMVQMRSLADLFFHG